MTRQCVELDIAEIERLAGQGMTEQEISHCLGISRTTLARRKKQNAEFTEAIQRGKAAAHAVVANALFELCKERNLGAIIWYEKSRCGLTEEKVLLDRIDALEKKLNEITTAQSD